MFRPCPPWRFSFSPILSATSLDFPGPPTQNLLFALFFFVAHPFSWPCFHAWKNLSEDIPFLHPAANRLPLPACFIVNQALLNGGSITPRSGEGEFFARRSSPLQPSTHKRRPIFLCIFSAHKLLPFLIFEVFFPLLWTARGALMEELVPRTHSPYLFLRLPPRDVSLLFLAPGRVFLLTHPPATSISPSPELDVVSPFPARVMPSVLDFCACAVPNVALRSRHDFFPNLFPGFSLFAGPHRALSFFLTWDVPSPLPASLALEDFA